MRLRVAKKVAKRHSEGAVYRQATLNGASKRLKVRLEPHAIPVREEVIVPVEVIDYGSMTATALKALAKERGLSGYSRLKKAEIIALLS
jgi:hypothetical protein